MENAPKIKVEIMQPTNEQHLHFLYADGWAIGNVWDTVDNIAEPEGTPHKYHIHFTSNTTIYADEIAYKTYKPSDVAVKG